MTRAVYTSDLEQNKVDLLTSIIEKAALMSDEDRDRLLQAADAIILVRKLRDLQLNSSDPKLAG